MEPFTIECVTYRLLPGNLLHESGFWERLFDLRSIVCMNALMVDDMWHPSRRQVPVVDITNVARKHTHIRFWSISSAEAFVMRVRGILVSEDNLYIPDTVGFAERPFMWTHDVDTTHCTTVMGRNRGLSATANAWQDLMTRA